MKGRSHTVEEFERISMHSHKPGGEVLSRTQMIARVTSVIHWAS